MKKNLTLKILMILSLILSSGLVYAKDSSNEMDDDSTKSEIVEHENEVENESEDKDKSIIRTIKDKIKGLRNDNKEERREFRASTSEQRKEIKSQIKELKSSGATESEVKEKINSLKETVKADREALKVKLEQKRKIMKTEIEAQIASFKADKKVKLDSAKKESVKTKLNGVFTRLGSAIAKLGTFDTKISAAIESKKANGLNTADAENALTVARVSLDDAKVALDAVSQAVTSSINDASGTSQGAIKEVVIKAQTSIKTAHSKYQEVIKLLPKSKTASSTTN